MVPTLLDAGHDVVGVDSDLYRDCPALSEIRSVPELRIDVRDVAIEHLDGFDAVIHLAALANDALSNLDPEVTADVNHRASVRLARLAREAGVARFLFASSCAVYGRGGDHFVDEMTEVAPVTAYNVTKFRVEQDVTRLAAEGFSPTFFRNATAYGLSPKHDFGLVLNNLVAWGTSTGRVLIKSDGSPWRPIVHVEDISHAFAAALEAPREAVHNEVFNVGSNNENHSVTELAELVRDVVGAKIEYAEGGGPDPRSYRVDFSKIRRHLPSFETRWKGARGVEQLHAAYVDAKLTPGDFESPRFNRLAVLRRLIAEGGVDRSLRWREQS